MDAEGNRVLPGCNTKYQTTSRRFPLVKMVNLARDGAVDFGGRPIDKATTGRLKANAFIIGKSRTLILGDFILKLYTHKQRHSIA